MMELARELIALLAAVPWIGMLAPPDPAHFRYPDGLRFIGDCTAAIGILQEARTGGALPSFPLESDCSC